MIVETFDVHNFPKSRRLLEADRCSWLLEPYDRLAWHFRQPFPIVAGTEVFLGAKAVNRGWIATVAKFVCPVTGYEV
jgi:hypothetical protein